MESKNRTRMIELGSYHSKNGTMVTTHTEDGRLIFLSSSFTYLLLDGWLSAFPTRDLRKSSRD